MVLRATWQLHKVSRQVDGRQTQSEALSLLGTDRICLCPWMPTVASLFFSLLPFLPGPIRSAPSSHRKPSVASC